MDVYATKCVEEDAYLERKFNKWECKQTCQQTVKTTYEVCEYGALCNIKKSVKIPPYRYFFLPNVPYNTFVQVPMLDALTREAGCEEVECEPCDQALPESLCDETGEICTTDRHDIECGPTICIPNERLFCKDEVEKKWVDEYRMATDSF